MWPNTRTATATAATFNIHSFCCSRSLIDVEMWFCVVWKWDIGKCHRQFPFCSIPFHSIAFIRSFYRRCHWLFAPIVPYDSSSRSSRIRHSINCFSYLVAPGLVCSIIIPSISPIFMSFSFQFRDYLLLSPPPDQEMSNSWQHKCANMLSLRLMRVLLLLFKHRNGGNVSYEQDKGSNKSKSGIEREWTATNSVCWKSFYRLNRDKVLPMSKQG